MNSVKIKLEPGVKIQWPNTCAMCGSEATHVASASFMIPKNIVYLVVGITYEKHTYSIDYPVCSKHKLICKLLDHPARESLYTNFLFLLLISPIISIPFMLLFFSISAFLGELASIIGSMLGFLIGFLLVALYLKGIFKPVRISNIENNSTTISIKNTNFFNNFKILNRDKIINE